MESLLLKSRNLYLKSIYDKKYSTILNQLANDYYNSLNCDHTEFVDKGYYKYVDGEVYMTDREGAYFRYVECPVCGENICLIKTLNENWDITYRNHLIMITNQKVKALAK